MSNVVGINTASEREPNETRPRREGFDWRSLAPRWLLISAIVFLAGCLLVVSGAWLNRWTRDRAWVDDRLQDTQTKTQGKLAEHVAVLDAESLAHKENDAKLAAEIAALKVAIEKLAISQAEVAAELRLLREERLARR